MWMTNHNTLNYTYSPVHGWLELRMFVMTILSWSWLWFSKRHCSPVHKTHYQTELSVQVSKRMMHHMNTVAWTSWTMKTYGVWWRLMVNNENYGVRWQIRRSAGWNVQDMCEAWMSVCYPHHFPTVFLINFESYVLQQVLVEINTCASSKLVK